MGQAKRIGSREQRIAKAIEREIEKNRITIVKPKRKISKEWLELEALLRMFSGYKL